MCDQFFPEAFCPSLERETTRQGSAVARSPAFPGRLSQRREPGPDPAARPPGGRRTKAATPLHLIKLIYLLFKPYPRTRSLTLERGKHGWERETPTSYLLRAPQPGTKPATEAGALPGNRTCDPSVHGRTMLQPAEPHRPGCIQGLT